MTTDAPEDLTYYKAPDASVRPGDIVRMSPFLQALKSPLVHVSPQRDKRSGKISAELLGLEGGGSAHPNVLSGAKETDFVLRGKFDFAILLTRGCDIENGKQRQVAAIRPLSVIQGVEAKTSVIEGNHTSLHYLPAHNSTALSIPDSVIDFRYIVTLNKDLFDALERPLALTREGLLDLYFNWMRHTIGKEIPKTTKCETCGAPIPIFADVAEIANPDADY